MLPQYGKAIVKKIMINNVDISSSLSSLYTGTSILTPFQGAKLNIRDSSMIQDALYESGVPISLVYSAGDGSTERELNLVSMANRGGVKTENNRSGFTEITGISQSYFNMHNEHTSHHQNIPASDALKKLHKELDPNASLTVTKSKGMIADREPFHLRGVKLWDGINTIRERMTDEKFLSGAYTYFLDHAGNYFSKPLEQLFSEAAGPTFSNKMAGSNFAQDMATLGTNIFSFEKGGYGQNSGTDNASIFRHALKQRGGDSGTGFNWQTMKYVPPKDKGYSGPKYPGATTWKGQQAASATMTNHKFNYDPNQKKQEDFEGSIAKRNAAVAMALQGSMTLNLPLEGGLQCTVGKGCYLDIPGEVGDQGYSKSTAGGQHLVLAQGEYIFMGDDGLTGVSSLRTASGGKTS